MRDCNKYFSLRFRKFVSQKANLSKEFTKWKTLMHCVIKQIRIEVLQGTINIMLLKHSRNASSLLDLKAGLMRIFSNWTSEYFPNSDFSLSGDSVYSNPLILGTKTIYFGCEDNWRSYLTRSNLEFYTKLLIETL